MKIIINTVFFMCIGLITSCKKSSDHPSDLDNNGKYYVPPIVVPAPGLPTGVPFPPFGPEKKEARRPGNSDEDALGCQSGDPDTDKDGVCDSKDRCPGFDDSVDLDKDLWPGPCDCNDNNPGIFPGTRCQDFIDHPPCSFLMCDVELSGACVATFEAAGTVCEGPILDDCDALNTCDGQGTCIDNKQPASEVCRLKAGECDVAENCDGLNNECPPNEFAPSGSVCGFDNAGSCLGDGHCDRAHACPNSTDLTDADGDNWTRGCDCDDTNPNIYPGRPCAPDTQECTNDICDPNLTGECLHTDKAQGRICGAPVNGACDAPDTCDGEGNCDANYDQADFICRPSTHQCDTAEFCSGTSASCPSDSFAPAGTVCGENVKETCDRRDICNNVGVCVQQLEQTGFVCRPAKDPCDIPETCTGTSASCPTDTFQASGTLCGGDPVGPCDVQDLCDASGVCINNVAPAGTSCRPAVSICDLSEECTGSSSTCPTDLYLPNGATGEVCNDTGYPGSCSSGHTFCYVGESICYPPSISCTRQTIVGNDDDLLGTSFDIDFSQSIIGADGTHGDGVNSDNTGSAYIYVLNGRTWQRLEQIEPEGLSDEIHRGRFGASAAISGSQLMVGAPDTDVANFGFNSQAVGREYFFGNVGNTFENQAFFNDPADDDFAFFGTSSSMKLPYAIASAPGERPEITQAFSGAAYIFFFNQSNGQWSRISTLHPDDARRGFGDTFGTSVFIDEEWAFVGSGLADTDGAPVAGAVYAYKFEPNANYVQTQFIEPPTNKTFDMGFGASVSRYGDFLVIGASFDSNDGTLTGNPTGSMYIYQLDHNTEEWIFLTRMVPESDIGRALFGFSLDIFGNVIVVGAPGHENGAVYVYAYRGGMWEFIEKINGEHDGDEFGFSVSISGNFFGVGAPSAEVDNDEGKAYFYFLPQPQ